MTLNIHIKRGDWRYERGKQNP